MLTGGPSVPRNGFRGMDHVVVTDKELDRGIKLGNSEPRLGELGMGASFEGPSSCEGCRFESRFLFVWVVARLVPSFLRAYHTALA